MFKEILGDDLCIAVLTDQNPNVFYELAVAQAAGRPVIILIHKGQTLPFDIQDLRCVFYDLKPRPLFEKVYVHEIVAHVKKLESLGWKVPAPFGVEPPLGGGRESLTQPVYYERSMDYGGLERLMDLLRRTEKVFEVMGVTLSFWRSTRGISDVIIGKASTGCRVRALLMHKDNPALPQMIIPTVPEMSFEKKVSDLDVMLKFWQKMAEKCSNIEVRQMRRGCLHFQLTRSDDTAVFAQYFFSEKLRHSPLWQCRAGTRLYDILAQEFESLWQVNDPALAGG
jgi:hypothetical protein